MVAVVLLTVLMVQFKVVQKECSFFSLEEKSPLDNINAKAPANSLAFANANHVYFLAKKKGFSDFVGISLCSLFNSKKWLSYISD
jgi:hypothetical protein